MNKLKVFLIIIFLVLSPKIIICQWFDKQSLQSTVLLEKIDNNNFLPHGTGFLLYNYKSPSDLIVVTCAHLLQGKQNISVRVNPDSSVLKILQMEGQKIAIFRNALLLDNTVRFIVNIDSTNHYIHPNLDIAAFFFRIPKLFQQTDSGKNEIRLTKLLSIPISGMENREKLSIGDEVYFVGFPLGYGTTNYVEPIIRSGSIAWLPKDDKFYLLDAFSYGGNSGSPVFQKMIVGSKLGELSWNPPKLVGMVFGHQSIELENILSQPKPNELKFETTNIDLNIGLAKCVYMDDIMYVIEKLKEKIK